MSKRWFWVLAALCALALALALLWMLAPRSVEPAPRQPLYILRDVNGRVARYEPDQDTAQTPAEVYAGVYTNLLPEQDVLALREGIPVYSEEELQRLLEDFGW